MSETVRRILVPIAEGSEEMEVTITVDVLRRAGADVVVAGLDGTASVTCSRGVRIVPDVAFAAVAGERFDAIVLPGGGPGSRRFAASRPLGDALRAHDAAGRLVAAICAAPSALLAHRIGVGRRLTAHPSVADAVRAHADWVEDDVVEDGTLVTSRGPGTAFAFALRLVERLFDADTAARVREPMMLSDGMR